MGIDLQYLLFLQNIRLATGGILDEFFNSLSKFTADLMPFMPFVLFWAVNKQWGYRAIFTHNIGELLNGVIKLSVCAYRPWIRSAEIIPAGDSKTAATGYSFPSGHTLTAVTTYGTIYNLTRKKRKGIAVLCLILIILTGFSRNYLGVHTPQDVIVGLAEGILMILLVNYLGNKIKGNEKLQDLLTTVGFLLVAAVIIYVTNKSYPMDYVDGKLLVDPKSMMNDIFKACGALTGLLIGSFIERRYIHFEVPSHASGLPALTALGFALMFAWKKYFEPATVVPALGKHWGYFVGRAVMILFALVIWPLVIKKECGKESQLKEN